MLEPTGIDDTPTGKETPQFTLTRTVDAPRATVWLLWTDPEELAYWLHPGGVSTPRDSISVDLRVGGRYRYAMVDDQSGEQHPMGGVYLEVSEPDRLVFTWGDPDGPVDGASVITVTPTERGSKTDVRLHGRGIARRPGGGGAYDGWGEALDVLVQRLATR